jgi:putative hydrolase of the HAD superfamily
MADINTLFWDVGGVVLTNAWDRKGRRQAAQKFQLDWEDFQDRHEFVSTDFESGRLTLEEYLRRTIFYRERPFSEEEFRGFMFSLSRPFPEVLSIVGQLTGRYLMATLNNESRELNHYRIEKFDLRRYFRVFFSSCFLGVRKPDRAIYQLALQMTQSGTDECVFIDDRPLNLECAQMLGMRTIRFQDTGQLREDLRRIGIQL